MVARQAQKAAVAVIGLVSSMAIGMGDAVGSETAVRADVEPSVRSEPSVAVGVIETEAVRRWKHEPFKVSLQGGGWQWCRLSVRKPFYDSGFIKARVRIRCPNKNIRFVVEDHAYTSNVAERFHFDSRLNGSEPEWNWNDRSNTWIHKVKFKLDWKISQRYQISARVGHGDMSDAWAAGITRNTET